MTSDKQVQQYAESTTTCRHVFICRYFGEKVDDTDEEIKKLYCNNMCDVSLHTLVYTLTDADFILLTQVCREPVKVARRAQSLTEEIQISSQVPDRPHRDREDFGPVHPVTFYGTPESAGESSRRSSENPFNGYDPPAGMTRPKGPPTAIARSSAFQGMRRTDADQRMRSPLASKALNEEEQRKEDDRKRKAAIITEGLPVVKKSKTAEPSPYNQSSQRGEERLL